MPIAQAPIWAPTAEAVMARAGGENFPVASRLLAPGVRSHLLAVYGFARLVDELGDSAPGDRLAALDWLQGELDAAFRGEAEHPLLVCLQRTLRECPLPRAPFERLIEANRVDQRVSRYRTWEELRGYCALSADPVGELVLGIFGLATPERIELSNSICTALQLTEHCQDVAEDLAQGRIYLPLEDLARFDCSEAELAADRASAGVRALLAFEVSRARRLLDDGAPLLQRSRGTAKLALAAFLAGGHAALDAIERADYDVLAETPRVSRTRHVLALSATLLRRGGGAEGIGDAASTAHAYNHCEAVTRREAANFFYGIRLLPRERRRGMCAVYAFARRVDDIGDGTLARAEKLRRLDGESRSLAAIAPGGPGIGEQERDLVIVALADAQRRFALPDGALEELIEGVRMDVLGVTYESFEELVVYCRRVAGAIGRVCLAIFGAREDPGGDPERAERLANDLGVALQLTNILRDLREDAENGRVYLPSEDLRRFGLIEEQGGSGENGPAGEMLASLARASGDDAGGAPGGGQELERLSALVRFESERARQWFDRGLDLAGILDRRSAACVLAMAGIYKRLLERIDDHPEEAARRRISLPAREKAWVAARGMLGARV